MKTITRFVAATITILFVLYALLAHEGGALMNHALVITGILLIGFGLTKSAYEQRQAEKVPVSSENSNG